MSPIASSVSLTSTCLCSTAREHELLRGFKKLLHQYPDHTIFAWGMSGEGRRGGLLAASPADFSGSANVVPVFNLHPSMSVPTRIPQGVQIHARLAPRKEKPLHNEEVKQRGWEGPDPVLKYALLDCHMRGDLHRVVAIPLIIDQC